MATAFHAAGFEPRDITMPDLLSGTISLQTFRGLCLLEVLVMLMPGPRVGGIKGVNGDPSQPRFIHNEFGRFECRVRVEKWHAIMLKGIEGSKLALWAAHGEGKAYFPDGGVWSSVLNSKLAPVKYCDDGGIPTDVYSFNLNGSPVGVAPICSPDWRHLAMMPNLEHCFLMWQFPWYPKHWSMYKKGPSPWLQMFQNAREWCS
ncbi:hypothetical protein ACH5RR_013056 [Cinchona calisaya]|uniref:Uncharacterized protein n=1 Tax=Cinchona calisaya TaxID=153742 RepID=A0ABD2ZYZ3_9GENT